MHSHLPNRLSESISGKKEDDVNVKHLTIRKGYNSIQQSIETVRLREELATHFDEIDLNKDHGKK